MTSIWILTLWVLACVHKLNGCPHRCFCSLIGDSLYVDCTHQDLRQVPAGVPPDVTILGLSGNKLVLVPRGSFENNTRLSSLWMAHNRIAVLEPGTLAALVQLQYLDLSHNKIAEFPWLELRNLTSLLQLKLTHNELVELPRDAFVNLQKLQSLHLNDNKFFTIAEGTFNSLASLKHLQIFANPFLCDCALYWLQQWMTNISISIPEQGLISCAAPEDLQGTLVGLMPRPTCRPPNVTISPDVRRTIFFRGSELTMTCTAEGDPEPSVTWQTHNQIKGQDKLQVYDNGTIVISHLTTSRNYSCSAENIFGEAKRTVFVEVTEQPAVDQPEFSTIDRTILNEAFSESPPGDFTEPQSQNWSRKCEATRNTHYVSNNILNGSSEDLHLFTFGIVSLSETDVTVRLDPLMRRSRVVNGAPENTEGADESAEIILKNHRLYLCGAEDRKHQSVQWTRIKAGISTYKFDDLSPGTNYSLCLTDRQGDCKVIALFTTGRREQNLLVIISVSICLLTVATIPLIGAICYHLSYKYRKWTRNLTEMNLNVHASRTESQSNIIGSSLDQAGGERSEKQKEGDSEETEFRYVSENGDRLPLGADAFNINGSNTKA